jgi:c-di-GMP-binding flagellar brake protein YcgR
LQSHHADQLVSAGSVATISAKLGLSNIAFDCIVDAPFHLNRTSTFSARFPSSLRVSEQRNAYRVKIPETMSLSTVQLGTDYGHHVGRLLDISRQGAGALLPMNINSGVSSRVSCSFQLLDAQFEARADVRSSLELNRHQRLGLFFEDLTASEHKRLDSTIAALERIILRDHARLLAR